MMPNFTQFPSLPNGCPYLNTMSQVLGTLYVFPKVFHTKFNYSILNSLIVWICKLIQINRKCEESQKYPEITCLGTYLLTFWSMGIELFGQIIKFGIHDRMRKEVKTILKRRPQRFLDGARYWLWIFKWYRN